ncbi:hypothetical protein [Streptomyces fagopyri]|uniref:hypothetical protein n=1 Tax=Streptomyces fagopyri TaxID=2662397 RepID=UPI0037F4793F
MTAAPQAIAAKDSAGRWSWPISPPQRNTAAAARPAQARTVADLGVRNLRRLHYHDPSAPDWRAIARPPSPPETVNAAPNSPPTPHRRRATLDVVTVPRIRRAQTGRTLWGRTGEERIHLPGRTQAELQRHTPAWTGDKVRPHSRRTPTRPDPSTSSTGSAASSGSPRPDGSSDTTASTARPRDFARS